MQIYLYHHQTEAMHYLSLHGMDLTITKFLGINISNIESWNHHIISVCKKANNTLLPYRWASRLVQEISRTNVKRFWSAPRLKMHPLTKTPTVVSQGDTNTMATSLKSYKTRIPVKKKAHIKHFWTSFKL